MTDQVHQGFDADVILVGGGLANCLIALRLTATRPDCRVVLVEAGDRICGNHTWSFHKTDIAPEHFDHLRALISHQWHGQKVIFPQFERELSTPYASISSESLRAAVYEDQRIEVRERVRAASLRSESVELSSGEMLRSPCVIDGRGYAFSNALKLGFQKFVGLELELADEHGETVPTIMDASVEQIDGYRFVYVLPLSATRLLVEDTRYSDSKELDDESQRSGALAYAEQRGWTVSEICREERGVLPITLAQDFDRYWQELDPETAAVGLRAGLFQPATGYSLPDAVRVANLIADREGRLTTSDLSGEIRSFASAQNAQQSFYRLLNRMLFGAAAPSERYRVLQRFYGLSQPLIERFYAGRLRESDKLRILLGKPPVPIHRAIGCVSESTALSQD